MTNIDAGSLDDKIGVLEELLTDDKSNVVHAINENNLKLSKNTGDIQGRAINVKYPPAPLVAAKGDANYFKTADGKWYSDSAYKQLATDDTSAFKAVDALGKPIFCPPGTYFTQGVDLLGFYYGKGAKIIVKERDTFNASIPPSQRTGSRTFILGNTPQPILNEFYGKNSGSKVQADAYANTSLGENALANLTTGKRNTAIGFQSQITNPSQYSNTSIGADSLSTGRFFTRITAIGENSLKWAGCLDPIKSRHELWVNEYDVYNLFLDPKSDFYRLKANNPNVEQIIQPTGYPAPAGAVIVNPKGGFPAATSSDDVSANVAIGRNSMLHHVKGSHNVAVGYQAMAHSYVSNSNTAIGNYALADALQGTENTAIGKNALSYNQTGSNNVVVGSGSMGSNIFGNRNTVIGSNAGGGFTGDNSILIGYKAKGLSSSSNRQLAIDYGNDGAPVPFLYGKMDIGSEYFGTRAKEMRLGGDGASNGGVKWITGTGVPKVAAPVGSMYTRTDGGAGTTLYVKESGTGTTGWVAK
ncbi:hypothetical protein [Peribacillus simplex]|uniref:hypothetical protein n=1 Tax=Peribacillus simplex TaxID=1478 RepID=UPI003D2DBD20